MSGIPSAVLRSLLIVAAIPVLALAGPSSGFNEIIRSAVGAGGMEISGGTDVVDQSIGEAAGSGPAPSTSTIASTPGDYVLIGYLSELPSFTLSPTVSSLGSRSPSGVVYALTAASPVQLQFSNAMTTPDVKVLKTIDSSGNLVASSASASAFFPVYCSSCQVLTIFPPIGMSWGMGQTYGVLVTSSAVDANGLQISSAGVIAITFVTPRDQSAPNVVTADGESSIQLNISSGAYPAPYFVTMTTGVISPDIQSANTKATSQQAGRQPLKIVEIDPFLPGGEANPVVLAAPATLSIPKGNLCVDLGSGGSASGTRCKTLAFWRLDEGLQLWVRQPASIVDTDAVRLVTNHFSIYAVMGALDTDVSEVYAFPVPFRPNAGDVNRYGSWATGIRFSNLPQQGSIDIYTISGQRVRHLDINANPQTWDVKNSAGETVASGVYLWEVISGSNEKHGKLVVIK
ncbi:MAG: T9SS type A sorting domain-containing protein [Elusimicrobia bacterium]|nr:T9SS type A sorting domain-containing protein [Elusimicrobiota bacterium]